MDKQTLKEYYTVREVGEILGFDYRTIKLWLNDGIIKGIRFGRNKKNARWRISKDEIERFKKDQTLTTE